MEEANEISPIVKFTVIGGGVPGNMIPLPAESGAEARPPFFMV